MEILRRRIRGTEALPVTPDDVHYEPQTPHNPKW
jgi:hypothetical protein